MTTIALEVEGARDLALIASDNSVWLVVPLRWWDLSTLLWWLLAPADRRARVNLVDGEGHRHKFYAVRVASRHVRIRGRPVL